LTSVKVADPITDDEDVSGDFEVGDRIRFTKFAQETFHLEIRASGDEVDGVFVVTEVIKASDGSWRDYALKSVVTDHFVGSRFRRSLLTPHPKVFDHSSIPYGHKEQMPLVAVTSEMVDRRG
jgi:hypothetical protein